MTQHSFKRSPFAVALALAFASPLASAGTLMCQHWGVSEHASIQQICPYQDGLAAFNVGRSWGLLDKNGRVVLEPEFDWIDGFSDGLAAVGTHDEKTGYVNRKGELVLPPRYDSGREFSEGVAPVHVGDKWGYIDRLGQWVLEPQFEDAYPFHSGVAIVQDDRSSLRLISRTGQTLHRIDGYSWVSAEAFNEHGLAVVKVSKPEHLVHLDGRVLPLPAGVDAHGPMVDGRFPASVRVDDNTLYGLMTLDGRWAVAPTWHSLAWEGRLAKVSRPGEDGSVYGLIDSQGKVVVEPRYSGISFSKGLYFAERWAAGERGTDLLDRNGSVVVAGVHCYNAQPEVLPFGVALLGCEKTIVLDQQGQQIALPIDKVEAFRVTAGGMVLAIGPEADSSGASEPALRFALLDAKGKLLLSGEDPAVKGLYDDIHLLNGRGALAEASPHLLPLAVLTGGYERMAIVTREGRVVSRPEWQYDRVSTNDGYGEEDEPLEGPLPVKTASGFGAIDGKGDWVMAPRFDALSLFRNGTAFAEKLGRDLVVDNTGGLHLIPEDAFRFDRVAPFVLEGEDREDRTVRMDVKRKTIDRIDPPASAAEGDAASTPVRDGDFVEGLAPARQKSRWGLVDEQGHWVVAAQYTEAPKPVMHGGRLLGWQVRAEMALRHPVDEDDRRDERHGLLGPKGNVVLPPIHGSVTWDEDYSDLVFFSVDGRNGVAKIDGSAMLSPVYESLAVLGDGWFAVSPKSQEGMMNTRGEWVLPPGYSGLSWHAGQYSHETDGTQERLVDRRGRTSSPEQPQTSPEESADQWWRNIEPVAGYRERTVFYGFDWQQRLVVDGEVDENFSEGRAVLRKNDTDEKVLIDSRGVEIGRLPYEKIEPMSNDRAAVMKPVARKRGETPAERYGYIDSKAKLVIPPRFEWAGPFSEDRATVTQHGNLAVIDKAGRVIVQGAWMCGTRPVLVDARQQIVWPKDINPALLKSKRCP